MVMSFGQATMQVMSGLYGPTNELGVFVCVALVAQVRLFPFSFFLLFRCSRRVAINPSPPPPPNSSSLLA